MTGAQYSFMCEEKVRINVSLLSHFLIFKTADHFDNCQSLFYTSPVISVFSKNNTSLASVHSIFINLQIIEIKLKFSITKKYELCGGETGLLMYFKEQTKA